MNGNDRFTLECLKNLLEGNGIRVRRQIPLGDAYIAGSGLMAIANPGMAISNGHRVLRFGTNGDAAGFTYTIPWDYDIASFDTLDPVHNVAGGDEFKMILRMAGVAVLSVAVQITRPGGTGPTVTIPNISVNSVGPEEYAIDLSALSLRPGDIVRVHLTRVSATTAPDVFDVFAQFKSNIVFTDQSNPNLAR